MGGWFGAPAGADADAMQTQRSLQFWADNAEAGDYDYDFRDYVPTTRDPGWMFSAAIIVACLCINFTLPLWLAIGKWWDNSAWQTKLNNYRQRKREEKKARLQGRGTRRFRSQAAKKDGPKTLEEDDDNNTKTKKDGTNNRAEPRITAPTEMFDLGSLSKIDIDADENGYEKEEVEVDIEDDRNVTNKSRRRRGDDNNGDDDDNKSISSTTSGVSNVASTIASGIAEARPRRTRGGRSRGTEAYKRRGEKKQTRDVKMAGELIAAQHQDDECHPISEGSSGDERNDSGNDDDVSVDGDYMTPLGDDAMTPLDTVSNHGGELVLLDEKERSVGYVGGGSREMERLTTADDDKSSVWTDDKHSAVPTVVRHKYRIGKRRKDFCTKLLEVADWDSDARRLCSLAFIYAGQGLISEFFSILRLALMSHYMGIRQVNARIMSNTLFSFTSIFIGGFEEALGLLVPQAHGADNPLMVGRYLQIVIVLYNIFQIPGAIIWGLYTYDAVLWFGYDEETAIMAQQYTYTSIIYMAVEAIEDCLWEWLEVVGHAKYAAIYNISCKFVEKGAFIALLAFGVTDLFTIGLANAIIGTIVVLVNFTIIITMGWLDPYWNGLIHTWGFNDRQALNNVFNISITSSIAKFLSYGEWELLTVFVRRMGPAEVTTWSLMGYVWGAFEVLTSGFSSASEVRVGFRMGANKPEQAKFMAEKGMYVTTVVAIFECGLVLSIAQYLPGWITPDPTLQKMLFQLTPMIGFGSILMVTGFVAWNTVYATGRVRLATFWETFITWFVTVPGCALMVFVFNFNLEGMTGAMIIGYAVAANLYMFMLLRTDWAKQAKRISEKHSGGLKYLDTDWDGLPRKIKTAAMTLGYTKKMWETNEEPPSNTKNWDELTPAEQSAAGAFGFNKRKWDANVSGNESDSSTEQDYDRYNWDDLPPEAREAAKVLGYTKHSWDNSQKVETSRKDWHELTDAQKEAATFLGYDRSWRDDDSSADGDNDHASMSQSKSTVSSLMLTDPAQAQHAAELLGLNRSSWNADDALPVEEKRWKDLTSEEKAAFESLGWTQAVWDTNNNGHDDSGSVMTAPSKAYGGYLFDDLPKVAKDAVVTLGYSASTWNQPNGSSPIEEKEWNELNDDERNAAVVLGFTEQTWNGPAGPTDASVSVGSTTVNTRTLPFVPGYKYYKIQDWTRLPIEVQEAALTLGYNQSVWESSAQSPVDNMYWEDMSPRLRAAARKLGFHQDLWDRVVRLNLKMLKRRVNRAQV